MTSNTDFEIIAVARDVKQGSPRDEPQLRFYLPYRATVVTRPSWILASVQFLVRTAADPVAMLPVLHRAVADRRRSPVGQRRVCRSGADRSRARAGAHDRQAVDRLRHVGRWPRVYRPVWADRLPGRAAHERDRHPHGARRAARGGVVGDTSASARVDGGRHRAGNSAGADGVARGREPALRPEPDGRGDVGRGGRSCSCSGRSRRSFLRGARHASIRLWPCDTSNDTGIRSSVFVFRFQIIAMDRRTFLFRFTNPSGRTIR